MISGACLLGFGLKFIFHWKGKLLILARLLNLCADAFMLCATGNTDQPFANGLAIEKGRLLDQ